MLDLDTLAEAQRAVSRMATTIAEVFAEAKALDAPLAVKLEHYAEALREFAPHVAAAYDRLVARLVAGEVGASAPRVGQAMPAFLMPNQAGHLVHSDALFAAGSTVLSFNRGHWCPFCRLEVSSLAAVADRVTSCGGRIVSITPEPAPLLRKLREETGATFTFLSDIDNGYALQLGLAMHLGEEVRSLMSERSLDLAHFHGNDHWIVPVPATFVIDQGGIVRVRLVNPDFRTRGAIDEILASLDG